MAFSNGTYTLYSPGNPVVSGTTIASAWANGTLSDIGTALTALGTSVTAALTATGSDQAGALQITAVINLFSTVAANTGAKLNSSAALDGQTQRQIIYNGGANILRVYPATGQSINQLATNAATQLAPSTSCEFFLVSATQWIALKSA